MIGEQYIGRADVLQQKDIYDAAKELNCDPMNIRALLAVETGGHGFDSFGRPIILFEPHVMWRVCTGDVATQKKLMAAGVAYPVWGTRPYPAGQDAQYQRIAQAAAIAGEELALRACSWGLGQQLGENFKLLGYTTCKAEVQDVMASERLQLFQMVRFLEKANAELALAQRMWYTVGRIYNGAGNAQAYAVKLANAYAQLHVKPWPQWPVEPGRVNPIDINLHPARPADKSADQLNAEWLAEHTVTA